MKFFRKLNPRTKFYLTNGRHLQFDTLDNQVGFFATDNGDIIKEIEIGQAEQRGGITSITHEEYEREYAQKKRLSPNYQPLPLNREEIQPPQNMSDTLMTKRDSPEQVTVVVGHAAPIVLNASDAEALRMTGLILPPPPLPCSPDGYLNPPPALVEQPITAAPEPVRPEPPPVRTRKTSKIKAAQAEAEKLPEPPTV